MKADGAAAETRNLDAALQRMRGDARVAFTLRSGITVLADLYQSGSAKIRLPKVYAGPPVAVLINTAGGITGGDRLTCEARVGAGAHAIVTAQAAERAYRSAGGTGMVTTNLHAQDGATLEWLPQETILFDASALSRRLDADLSGSARLLAVESVILGRTAMGETLSRLAFRDRWRIRRDGRLVFADDIRLDGDPTTLLSGPATAAGARAFATVLDCAPDAPERLALARDALPRFSGRAAASAWNGVLLARFVGPDARDLRSALAAFLETYRAAALPRVWSC
ncbi:urease accessory protein UreD [Polymorphum gilvum]|uniref:Urease accessory protein UreD n=1 Tax=Polymorphum gilvum (strain LMG 25793 / CGMCC 1.9160 / SL003B-26A1) TaxID=991905 RepID=F2IZC3_POLGS|nr:urease accessory protein UreD [Polymorphum gilvum]ADZ68546.1 Urease accessory protein ureD [Polymorphum gilvum SL003B-26A1]